MLAVFCLRLATGLLAALLLLSPSQVNPRFFRTHFLTVLGLGIISLLFEREVASGALLVALIGMCGLALLGSMVWLLEGAPGGRALILLALPLAIAALALLTPQPSTQPGAWIYVDHLASAALLGSALTAMLIGHSYLIAPAMSLTPLLRLLAALAGSTVFRLALAGLGLWLWTRERPASPIETETILLLAVRWLVGFAGPLVLGWMAWETARIRSTQSATGILYVVVILCFLGELTSQLLLSRTGFIL